MTLSANRLKRAFRPATSFFRPDTDISRVAPVWSGTANHWKKLNRWRFEEASRYSK